jgi:hypothetical protein
MGVTLTGFVASASTKLATRRTVAGESNLSPDAALQELMDGNRRFTSGHLTAYQEDLAILKQKTSEKGNLSLQCCLALTRGCLSN